MRARASHRQVEIMSAALDRWRGGGGTTATLATAVGWGPGSVFAWASEDPTSRRIPWRAAVRMYDAGALDASEAGELTAADPECPTPEEIATLAMLVGA